MHGYSVHKLRGIYLFEVASVVFPDLLVVAGEWAGFYKAWLFIQVAKRARRRSLRLWEFVRTAIGKRLMTFATDGRRDTLVKILYAQT